MKITYFAVTAALVATVACSDGARIGSPSSPTSSTSLSASTGAAGNGFNQFGYNYNARIFNGLADGTDNILDGKVWGNPTYANDHLVMKWNAAWDACNDDPTPENCAGAWTNNEWNGHVQGGSGEMWLYKIKWNGACGSTSTPLLDGGYCIWGSYEVIFSQGTVANQHFWDAHAIPAGFGS